MPAARWARAALWTALGGSACAPPPEPVDMRPALATAAAGQDADDPAVWVNPAEPARSLILGTNKAPAPDGALLVFGLDGRVRQTLAGLDRPNNVDVEYGLPTPGGPIDIAVVTERGKGRLRVFRISPEGLVDVSSGGGLLVFAGESAERGQPMGVALYRRSRDLSVFAILSRKSGPRDGYLWQYELRDDGTGKIRADKVRELGRFSGKEEIEAIAVDDQLGYVYYSDEGDGVHKWRADPEHPQAGVELAHFARDFSGDQEGIGIYARADGTGYLVLTEQLAGNSKYHVYPREGQPGRPHDHQRLKFVRGGADSTDGIEVVSASLGPAFPHGLLAAMNSRGRNFLLFKWEDLASFGPTRLKLAD